VAIVLPSTAAKTHAPPTMDASPMWLRPEYTTDEHILQPFMNYLGSGLDLLGSHIQSWTATYDHKSVAPVFTTAAEENREATRPPRPQLVEPIHSNQLPDLLTVEAVPATKSQKRSHRLEHIDSNLVLEMLATAKAAPAPPRSITHDESGCGSRPASPLHGLEDEDDSEETGLTDGFEKPSAAAPDTCSRLLLQHAGHLG